MDRTQIQNAIDNNFKGIKKQESIKMLEFLKGFNKEVFDLHYTQIRKQIKLAFTALPALEIAEPVPETRKAPIFKKVAPTAEELEEVQTFKTSPIFTNAGEITKFSGFERGLDITTVFTSIRDIMNTKIMEGIQKYRSVKIHYILRTLYINDNNNKTVKVTRTKASLILSADNVTDKVSDQLILLNQEDDAIQNKGSRWVIVRVLSIELHVNNSNPFRAKSYIDLPK